MRYIKPFISKICVKCNVAFETKRYDAIHCSAVCYNANRIVSQKTRDLMSAAGLGKKKPADFGEKLSKALTGKPKPWNMGERNPNFGGLRKNNPEAHERMVAAIKKRGQPWAEKDRARHSETMKGSANKMRGNKHSDESKRKMSESQTQRLLHHKVSPCTIRISKPEKDILRLLIEKNISVITQFRIPGVSFFYDFFFPSKNLILEYNGDYWHFNPKKYSAEQYVTRPNQKPALVQDIWDRDNKKKEAAISSGYCFVVMWEEDYKKHGTDHVLTYLI